MEPDLVFINMGKCSYCHETGHTIRTCSKVTEVSTTESDSVPLDPTIRDKLQHIVRMCVEVSSILKKGFSESVYEEALTTEFQLNEIQYSTQEIVPVFYKDRYVGSNRLDIILHTWLPIIIELKATTTAIKPDEKWQVVRYMTRKNYSYGAIVNFNQSIHGQLEIVFIINYKNTYYQFNHEPNVFTKMIDF